MLSKQTISTIGRCVELSGHLVLTAAAIVGIFAIPLVMIAAAKNDKGGSSEATHSHSSTTTTVPSGPRNHYSISNHFININPFYYGPPPTVKDFIQGMKIFSIISSAIGCALALYLNVPWMALVIGGLWLGGYGLTELGEGIIQYANQLEEEVIEPGAPLSYQLFFGCSSSNCSPDATLPSAPSMND